MTLRASVSATPGAACPANDTPSGAARGSLDETAGSSPDAAAALADAFAQRAELRYLAQQQRQQNTQFRLDRMRADFNARQEEHAEILRELNALRDMAMEQAKINDELLKKYIALI